MTEASPAASNPLARPTFRALWIATIASLTGTWMQDVGAGWLMATLAPSPVMVSLVQASATLPMFLLALPSGALADVVDRRRLLIFTQAWMLLAAAGLAAVTLAGEATPEALLAFTFLLGVGGALNAPAWQAIVPELVPRAEMPQAVMLQAAAINGSRAVGPALGGAIVASQGPGAAFLLNAVSFLGVIVVLWRWRRPRHPRALPAERFVGAMRAGLRYVRHAAPMQAVLVRAAVFILFGTAPWALLPLLAKERLGAGASGYGVLLAFLGLGAVAAAFVLPRLRGRASIDAVAAGGTALYALAAALLGAARSLPEGCAATLLAGAGWLAVLTSLNVGAQATLPGWVRARALSVYLLVFFGGMAGGSALWGATAARVGLAPALWIAAAGAALGLAAVPFFRLQSGEGLDLSPSVHWPAPQAAREIEHDRGPVMVTVEYRVDPARAADFAREMEAMRRWRLRDGAFSWTLFADAADPGRYLETFAVESWLEHLRQHERVTMADREVQARALAFHLGDAPPAVTHLLAEETGA